MNTYQQEKPWPQRDVGPRPDDDRGAILVMILVLIVITGLLIVPTLSYAAAALRHDQVVSTHAGRSEAVKAALRVALGNPRSLYEYCNTASAKPLQLPQLDQQATTDCSLVEEVTRFDNGALPWDLVVTRRGAPTPNADRVVGQSFSIPDGANYGEWLNVSTRKRIANPTAEAHRNKRSIWSPQLPSHAPNVRSAAGYEIGSAYLNPGFSRCNVYFPGTYPEPLTITGPAYFVSGIYYFEQPIYLRSGAEVVFGNGQHQGCTDDQRAAFNAIGVPSTHNITGVGATMILGKEARLDISAQLSGRVTFRMNARYVPADATPLLPSEEVSIMTVNGAIDDQGNLKPIDNRDRLIVPAGEVGAETPYPATEEGYKPSTVTVPAAAPTTTTTTTTTTVPPPPPPDDPTVSTTTTPPTTTTSTTTTTTPPPPTVPVIQIVADHGSTVDVDIPGYVAAPQGLVTVARSLSAAGAIRLDGALLVGEVDLSGCNGSCIVGQSNEPTQRVIRLESRSSGPLRTVADAVVQINSNGAWSVNSWEVQRP